MAVAYAFLVEPHWVDWHDEEVVVPGLPRAMDGFRVFQLTDMHLYHGLSAWFFQKIIEACNRQRPDLVVLTGDLINHSVPAIPACAEQLSHLKTQHGVLCVLGGHDYRSFAPRHLMHALENAGVRVIHNEAAMVGPGDGTGFWVVGLDDNSGWGKPDLAFAMKDVPAGAPAILIMHSPDSILKVADREIALALAGHTHGGQVCLPLYGPLRTMSRFRRRFARGRSQVKNTVLYVSRGLGAHHRVRFLARPEVVRLTLRAG